MEELDTPSPEEKKAFSTYHKQMHRAFEHLGSKEERIDSKHQKKDLLKVFSTDKK